MLSEDRVPYTGPCSHASTKMTSKSPTIEALKRAIARLGYMSWRGDDFTQSWPRAGAFDKAFRRWQMEEEMPADGVYGRQTWKEMRRAKIESGQHKGEYALDAYAQKLIHDEWEAENVPDEQDVRLAIVEFCQKAEANEDAWHYRMARPLDVSVDPSASYIVSDCSMYVIQAYNYARRKTSVDLADPSKMNWSGYGNCCDPAARTLTTDLRWVPLGDLEVGDVIWGFDEMPEPPGDQQRHLRKYRRATVTESFLTEKDCVRVCMDDGSTVICSADHPWLVRSEKSGNWMWREATKLFPYQLTTPRLVCRPFLPWSEIQTYETGWLAGMFDGEGHVAARTARGSRPFLLGITQAVGPTADRLVETAQRYGHFAVREREAPLSMPNAKVRVEMWSNGGGLPAMLTFLGTIRPERLIANLDLEGCSLMARERTEIVAVEPVGMHEVQSISTSTGTYLADGFAVHNTDMYEDDHPRVGEPYRPGDLAHYQGHVALCRRGGTARTAVFSSHGQEAGPMPVSLHYRSDLRFVCRPPLI